MNLISKIIGKRATKDLEVVTNVMDEKGNITLLPSEYEAYAKAHKNELFDLDRKLQEYKSSLLISTLFNALAALEISGGIATIAMMGSLESKILSTIYTLLVAGGFGTFAWVSVDIAKNDKQDVNRTRLPIKKDLNGITNKDLNKMIEYVKENN